MDTPSSTPSVTPTEIPTIEPTDTVEPTATEEIIGDLLERLPTLDDMASGFALTEEVTLTASDIAATHPDPNASLNRLQELGFIAAASRRFEIPSPGLADAMQRMIMTQSSVYEFETENGANGYIDFNREITKASGGEGILDVSVEEIGDRTAGIQGTITTGDDEAIVAMIWVRDGRLIYRFQGVSLGYNSLPDIIEIAEKLVEEWGS